MSDMKDLESVSINEMEDKFRDSKEYSYKLGKLYKAGFKVGFDIKKSIKYFKNGCDLGCNKCMYELGSIYHSGAHIKRDLAKGRNLLVQSVNNGNIDAMWKIGLIFYRGKFTNKNLVKAHEYFLLGEKHEHPECTYQLSLLYSDSNFIHKNNLLAIEYGIKALKLGHPGAYIMLHNLLDNKDILINFLYKYDSLLNSSDRKNNKTTEYENKDIKEKPEEIEMKILSKDKDCQTLINGNETGLTLKSENNEQTTPPTSPCAFEFILQE